MAIHNVDIHKFLGATHNNMMVPHLIMELILRYSKTEIALPKDFLDIH